MGSDPYWYFEKFDGTVEVGELLKQLHQREFNAGRYDPAWHYWDFNEPPFPITKDSPAPGPVHKSLEAVWEDEEAWAEGTRSILDLREVSDEPGFCLLTPVAEHELMQAFGTMKPTRSQFEDSHFFPEISRGEGIYIILYRDDEPDEIFILGMSID